MEATGNRAFHPEGLSNGNIRVCGVPGG